MIRIDNIHVFDGHRSVGTCSVEFDDRLITHLGPPGGSGRTADETIDGRGRTLLPGLIDAHTHAYGSIDNLALALAFGVTTEIDLFSFPPGLTRDLCARAATSTDVADLRSAGVVASATGGVPGAWLPRLPTLATPDEAEAFVAARHGEGAHLVKIVFDDGAHHGADLPALDTATARAVVAAAHDRGLLTVAHTCAVWSVERALDAGVDILTHLPLEAPLPRDLVKAAADTGRAVIPTLAILQMSTEPGRGRALAGDPRITDWLPPHAHIAITAGTEGLAVPHPVAGHDMANAMTSARTLHEAGVCVLAGTDANNAPGRACPVVHGASMHAELPLLVSAGLTPVEALVAATSSPAERFGLTDRGTIAVGRRADLLMVHGDPTADITDTRAIDAIWREGVQFDRARLLTGVGGTR